MVLGSYGVPTLFWALLRSYFVQMRLFDPCSILVGLHPIGHTLLLHEAVLFVCPGKVIVQISLRI